MLVGVLKTDGGPHPAETWAQVTASQVIDIASSASDVLLQEARLFESKIVSILTKHHTDVQHHERDGLEKDGTDRLDSEIDTSEHVDEAVDDIIAAARGTSFAAHFAKPEVRGYLEKLLHEHFHHSMHIERSWHADEHADHPAAEAFRKRLTGGVGAYAGNPPKDEKTGAEPETAKETAPTPVAEKEQG